MQGQQGGVKSNFKETMKRWMLGWYSICVRPSTREAKIIRILCRGLVVMENSHQLNNLYVTCTAHLSSQPSKMPDSKLGLEMLSQPDTLELHTASANYQTKIWLQADQEHMYSHPFSHRHLCMDDGVRLLESCLDKITRYSRCVTCGCKAKSRTAWCSCFKTYLNCTYAYGCDGVDCCNPAGQ